MFDAIVKARGSQIYMQYRFQLDMDQRFSERTIYNFLDYLGDIGGLLDALNYIGAFIVWVLTGNGLSQFMVSKLFKIDKNIK